MGGHEGRDGAVATGLLLNDKDEDVGEGICGRRRRGRGDTDGIADSGEGIRG